MKIFGSRGNGRRVANGNRSGAPARAGAVSESGTDTSDFFEKTSSTSHTKRADATTKNKKALDTLTPEARKARRKKRFIIAGSAALLVVAAVMLVIFTPLWDTFFRPGEELLARPDLWRPVFDTTDPESPFYGMDPDDIDFDAIPIEDLRSVNDFTFLILGVDGTANTDVVMVGSFDSENHSLEIVSIPRDTMVNVSWNVRKVNSIQGVMRNQYRNEPDAYERAMEATVEHFRNLLGFPVDFWVTINMRAFINLVDAVGGIDFNVPVGMSWRDPEGGFTFNLSRGQQRVNGNNALGLMRFRGYGDGDITRISVQQDFMLAAMTQMLAGVNAGNITTFMDIFLNHVNTNLQMTHLAWLGREFLNMNTEDINFTTMPGRFDSMARGFYITLYLDEWLEIVNDKLSPLHTEVTAEDVSILTRGPDGALFVTDGNWQGTPWR